LAQSHAQPAVQEHPSAPLGGNRAGSFSWP
jgi:hypothetical protein